MMELLLPLGLLGLLGILALILIYIIKPNYQQKYVSSTYIWKLSLKYKKRKLPTNKIRNILIFVCQLLILTSIALILAQPIINYEDVVYDSEVIAVIDSSASMYAQTDGETRFKRAVDGVIGLSDETFANGGLVSVILADDSPHYLRRRVSTGNRAQLDADLLELASDETACSFGESDTDAVIGLCSEILLGNPTARIYWYTDTTYDYVPDEITLVSVAEDAEWNGAILDASASLVDNYYSLTVQVACYGVSRELNVEVTVDGANAQADAHGTLVGSTIEFSQSVFCTAGQVYTVIFRCGGGSYVDADGTTVYYDLYEDEAQHERFYSFDSIHVSIENSVTDDSLHADDNYAIYGGQKEVLKVQYASADPNPFFGAALSVLKGAYERTGQWDMQITEVKKGTAPATSGFDFYIYEHEMPSVLPTDGVIFLVDPLTTVTGAGFRVGDTRTLSSEGYLQSVSAHGLLDYMSAEQIFVTRYQVLYPDASYEVLLTCDNDPILMVQDNENVKIAVMSFSVHYSNLAILPEFYTLVANMFGYFKPYTLTGNAFDVGETITIAGKDDVVHDGDSTDAITQFPATIVKDLPGTYTLRKENFFGKETTLYYYVKMPSSECDVRAHEVALSDPQKADMIEDLYDDLLVYVAAALVALLFIEWILQARENM